MPAGEVPSDQTLFQSPGDQSAGKRLSLQATTPPADVPGYRLQRFLGSGAFGQVWVGRDLNTGRGVAVKFYLHRGGVNWSLLSREVKNLVQLSADRHVVQVLEVGWDADPPYYVMELIEGGSLEEVLRARGRLPVAEAVEIFRKICIGLNHCHNKGVLHCDVKPANILMAADDEPRLADFGQSRMSHDQAPALGTLFYMAPEQADLDANPDASWDVYAAGAILYRMLTGNPPHRDKSLLTQLDTAGSLPKRLQRYRTAIREAPPLTEHRSRRGVDRGLAMILERSLAVDPERRYRNVQQILGDLQRREIAKGRKPLLLLGIVGPLLLLVATCLFGTRSINHAVDSTTRALKTEASASNLLAARYAAQTLQTEIERYFELTADEAARRELQDQLARLINDPAIGAELKRISHGSTPPDDAAGNARAATPDAATTPPAKLSAAALADPARIKLDQILAQRLAKHSGEPGSTQRPLATMFVTDRHGTMLGIAYAETVAADQNSVGKNFAQRTYFHGGRRDLNQSTPIASIRPLRATHLSAAFRSTATVLWKVAVSTPIYLDDDSREPDGVFVATINLGDFKLLQSEAGANQLAVLVEAREGPERGTILQHPLMDATRRDGKTLADTRYQLPAELMDRLLMGDDVDYQDPMATAEGGEDFAGDWIAAIQPIRLPEAPVIDPDDPDAPNDADPKSSDAIRQDDNTDLLVLFQYRLAKVFEPVGQMRRTLLHEGAAAIAAILLVTAMWWTFVNRATRPSDRPEQSDGPRAESSGETETLLAK